MWIEIAPSVPPSDRYTSQSARTVWIEISQPPQIRSGCGMSQSARTVWIEIIKRVENCSPRPSQSARTVWIEILRMAVISPPMPVTVCEDCVHVADLNLVIFQLRSYQRKNVGVYELISYTSTFIIESSYQFESHKNRNPLRTLHHTSCLNITREAWAPPRWILLWAVLIVTLLKPSLVFRFGKIKFFALEVIVTLRQ